MRKTTSQIVAVEGWGSLLVGAVVLFILLLLEFYRVGFLVLIALAFGVYYFRNLEKTPDERDGFVFLAPVDGVVKSISASEGQSKIVLHNRIIDEHMIRMPTQGSVEIVAKRVGIAANFGAGLEPLANRTKVAIKSASNGVGITVSFRDHIKDTRLYGDKKDLYLGERIGIFYGGEAVVTTPRELEISVNEGDFVVAGKSVIGYVRKTGGK